MMKKLIINARRVGYDTDQCGTTMTVGELIELLQNFDEDRFVYLSHDNGYTFGNIREDDIDVEDDEE